MENQTFQNIISRYFRGQLTDCEYLQLTTFLKEKEKREYFERAKEQWDTNPELNDKAIKNLNLLQDQIKRSCRRIINHRPQRLWVQLASAAAILIFGLISGSTVTYLISKNKAVTEELVFQTPRGEKSKVQLPDGSEVWLNANSRLIYHSFSTKNREVELNGEAFFKITPNHRTPFIVKTNQCSVKVMGTTFNVMAYDEFGRKEITLLNGKVSVQMEGREQQLNPGQTLILKNRQFSVVNSGSAEASAWVENKFDFRNIPFSELIKRLENWYDVDIYVDNKAGKEVNFTGTFKNEETIWQVLDAIKVYTPIEYLKTDLRRIKVTVK
jgi:ferric-dicitrate binding protein FerR (iron transport regulator)